MALKPKYYAEGTFIAKVNLKAHKGNPENRCNKERDLCFSINNLRNKTAETIKLEDTRPKACMSYLEKRKWWLLLPYCHCTQSLMCTEANCQDTNATPQNKIQLNNLTEASKY